MFPLLDTSIFHWSSLINFIVSTYFDDGSTVCIVWNKDIEFQLAENHSTAFVNIYLDNLEDSFEQDIFNYTLKAEDLQRKNLYYNGLIMKIILGLDISHCEGFFAFQEDIPRFTFAFDKGSSYAKWRSHRTKFLFGYRRDLEKFNYNTYFRDTLFKDQPRILVIETETRNSSSFILKTNKFVGPLDENLSELYVLNSYDGRTQTFSDPETMLYPDKLRNLQGREVILGSFDYRPFIAFDTKKQPQYTDRALDNPQGTLHVDGTEARILITFCEIYNCTFQVDSSEKEEWGDIFDNGTGFGLEGMVVYRKVDVALDAIYIWETRNMDVTMFLGRSGVTCLVPKPSRLTSWILPLQPFQANLWLGICICLLIEAIALWLTYHAELILILGEDDKNHSKSSNFGYTTTLKIFVSQAPYIDVVSLTVRTMLFSCFMTDIIITSIYSGGLASILTLPILEEAPDSVERLHKFGIPWAGSSEAWIFGLETDDEKLITDLVSMYRIYTYDQLHEFAKTENMGFVVERLNFGESVVKIIALEIFPKELQYVTFFTGHYGNTKFLTQEALDRLKLMVDDIMTVFCAGIVPRQWALLPNFDNLILIWHSSGMDEFWEWRVSADFLNGKWQKQIELSANINTDTGPVELDMANFSGLIIIWCLGSLLSVLAFLGEIVHHKHKMKQPQVEKLNSIA